MSHSQFMGMLPRAVCRIDALAGKFGCAKGVVDLDQNALLQFARRVDLLSQAASGRRVFVLRARIG